ncbi:cytochrome-c peroxidase, partial [Pseudomonas syringae]
RHLLHRESPFVRGLYARSAAGLRLVSTRPDDGTLAIQLASFRTILRLDADAPATSQPTVFADNHQGGRLATDYLLRHGHRRIAHVSGPSALMSARERYAGYREAPALAGIAEVPVYPCLWGYSRHVGRISTAPLLALPPPPEP